MIAFVATFFVVLIIMFIYWQFKMLKKYALTYDKFKINIAEKHVLVNGQKINFTDIDHITVRELPQPSPIEKTLSKSAFYAYMSEMELHLKQGERVPCTFHDKGTLYYTLKKLTPYVHIAANMDHYKPAINGWFLLGIIIAILLGWMMRR